MRILLDTPLYLWCLGNTPKMTNTRRTRIEQADEVYISAASIWSPASRTVDFENSPSPLNALSPCTPCPIIAAIRLTDSSLPKP